ncbi:MAG TPA: ion channel [Cytophagaceae bacterium]|jgi:inward rectifier potassium channel
MIKESGNKISGNDLGFGTKATLNHQRTLNRDGASNVKRIGLPFFRTTDTYNALITMGWGRFSLIILVCYIFINIIFASIYVLIGTEHFNGLSGTTEFEKFLDAFFFSAQTISTVGYGHISPNGILTSFVAAFESMMGLLAFALATGLLYGRFSRPMAKIVYSRNMLIAPYGDGKGLMLRIANHRSNQLVEVESEVLLTINSPDADGKSSRKFYNLSLERKKITLLSLSWTIVHPITYESPLFNLSQKDFEKGDAEFMVMIKAFDDTFSQTVHSRTSFKSEDIVWSAKFKPVFYPDEDGVLTLDFSKMDDYERVQM